MSDYLMVLDRNEVQLDYLTKAKNVQERERLNGELLLSFDLPLCDEYELLELEGYIKHDGQLFVIKNIEEIGEAANSVQVQCTHVYIEAVDEYIDRTVELFGVTCDQAVAEVLEGTPFTVGIINAPGLRDIDLTEMSLLKALQEIREKWDVDLWFDNRTVYLGQRGQDNGEEIRYGRNLKTLRKPTTTTNVITRLYVYGKDGLTIEAVNGGVKYLDSPNIGLYRRPKIGTVRFNDIDDANELMQEGQRYLEKNDKVILSYSTDFIEMGLYNLGDIVTITHVPFNIQTIGTRVVELIRYPKERRPATAVFSSFIETTIDDVVRIRRRQYAFEQYSVKRHKQLKQEQLDGMEVAAQVAAAEAQLAKTQAQAYADGIVTAEEQARIDADASTLNAAMEDATLKMNAVYAVAEEAQLSADQAQDAADAAQTSADAANALLTDISSDSKLTASEKQTVKKEWDIITGEKPTLEAHADIYSITTEKASYQGAFDALNSYLSPLLENLSTTSSIVRTTFRAKFKDYYDKRTLLLKVVADKAKLDAQAKADAAQTAATAVANAAQAAADAAQAAANTAQAAAGNAQTSADTANAKLSDIASDSKLTPLEKQATKKEWDAIVVERPTVEAQATAYGITTELASYTNAYTALNTYINPLLTDLTATSDIVGSVFRDTFRDYYDKKTLLLKAIADKAKLLAELAEANAITYTDTNYSDTKTKVENGDLVVKDKYGQVIVDEDGLDLGDVAGFGIQKGGIIRLENRTHAQTRTTLTSGVTSSSTVVNVGSTDGFPTSGSVYLHDGTSEFPDLIVYTGKTATSFTGVSNIERSYASGSSVFLWTQPVADVVVSAMEVYTPAGKFFSIPENRFNAQTLGAGAGDFDGWEFRYLYVDANGAVQYLSAGTSGGLNQYPPNPPVGSIRLGYLLVGIGAEQPDGTLDADKDWDSSGYPIFKERIYHDVRYRDERAVRAEGNDVQFGGAPYGAQTLAVSAGPKEYKTYYLQVGKGRRSVNASITLDSGSGYDNYTYGASLVVGRKAANDADGLGRPLWATYVDAAGNKGHVSGQRNISPYGVHVLDPRVWNKTYTMLYDVDLMPDPSDPSVIALKLTFYNYSASASESFNLKVNWHAL